MCVGERWHPLAARRRYRQCQRSPLPASPKTVPIAVTFDKRSRWPTNRLRRPRIYLFESGGVSATPYSAHKVYAFLSRTRAV